MALSVMCHPFPATYLQNLSGGVSQECLKMYTCLEEWKCFFAPVSITFVHTDIALLQIIFYFSPALTHRVYIYTVRIPFHQDTNVCPQLIV